MNFIIKLMVISFCVANSYSLSYVILEDKPHLHKLTVDDPNVVTLPQLKSLQKPLLPLPYNLLPEQSHYLNQNLIPASLLISSPFFQVLLPNYNYNHYYLQSPLAIQLPLLDYLKDYDDLEEYDQEEKILPLHHPLTAIVYPLAYLNSDSLTLTLPNYQPGNFLFNPKFQGKDTKIGDVVTESLLKGLPTDEVTGMVKEAEDNGTVAAESLTVTTPVEAI